MNTASKRIVLSALSLAVLAASAPVQARAGSSSSSRSSSSPSRPAPAPAPRPAPAPAPRPAPAPAPKPAPAPAPVAAPQRATIGGMQRPDVMTQARNQPTPAPKPAPAPVPAPAPMVAAPAVAPAPQPLSGSRMSAAPGAAGTTSAWSSRQESDRLQRERERLADERRLAEQRSQRTGGLTTGQALGAAAVVGVGAYMLGSNASAKEAPAQTPAGSNGGLQVTPTPSTVQQGASTSVQTPMPQAPANGEAPQAGNGGAWPTTPPSQSFNGASTEATSSQAALAAAQESGGGLMGMLKFVLLLALLGIGGLLAFRFFRSQKKPAVTAPAAAKAETLFTPPATAATASPVTEQSLLDVAERMFREVQEANNAADKQALERLVDEAFLPVLVDDIDNRTEPSRTRVYSVGVGEQVLGFSREGYRYVASVHFSAKLSEGAGAIEDIEEVWHFVANAEGADRSVNNGWKLAGIEAV